MKIKITIAYDGSHYVGWQIQPNGVSIQEKIEQALLKITQTQVKITGAGRTDAGVHARGQVAHFNLENYPITLLQSLNALIPKDISITHLEIVDDSFHSRFSAKEKVYTYDITTGKIQLPFDLPYSLHYTYPLDFTNMEIAISHLIGEHDFSAFANDAKVFKGAKNPVKTLREISIDKRDDGFALTFRGNGFLYKMVRNLTGLILDIGRGKKLPIDAKKILESKDRSLSSPAAPAHGLTLTSILY